MNPWIHVVFAPLCSISLGGRAQHTNKVELRSLCEGVAGTSAIRMYNHTRRYDGSRAIRERQRSDVLQCIKSVRVGPQKSACKQVSQILPATLPGHTLETVPRGPFLR